MKSNRLFQIIYLLLEKKTITAPELAKRLSVSVRTIYRDVEAISMAGIPVYSVSGNGGGISLMPEFKLDKAFLSDEEWRQIIFALQSLKVSDESVEKLLSKIRGLSGKKEQNWLEVDFSRWGHKKDDTDKFNLLKQAVIQKIVIQIVYYDAQGKRSCRKLKPVKLLFRNANWYLCGFCMLAEDYRCFKISRIAHIVLTEEQFEEDFGQIPDLEADDKENVIPLRFRIDDKEAHRAYDEFGSENIKKQEDNSVILSCSLPFDNWLFTYILSYGIHIEILEPVWLKEEIRRYIEKLFTYYET